ncbi:MAG: response regulator transcription factor [Saprospiraceae bacterium]|nr:response regulator transcription factor [Saprospiraceae bacterium]
MKPIRLVLYDEHPIITDAIQHYLSQYYNVKVQKICCSVEDLLNHLKDHQVDIIITGILSSDEIGISLISQIKKLNKMAKIIAFSSISSSFTIQTIMEAGADAFVSKKTGIENLFNKIMEVNLKEKIPCTNIKPTVKLTNKEKNIINLLKQGKSSK